MKGGSVTIRFLTIGIPKMYSNQQENILKMGSENRTYHLPDHKNK